VRLESSRTRDGKQAARQRELRPAAAVYCSPSGYHGEVDSREATGLVEADPWLASKAGNEEGATVGGAGADGRRRQELEAEALFFPFPLQGYAPEMELVSNLVQDGLVLNPVRPCLNKIGP
jgi:hypothetical protein